MQIPLPEVEIPLRWNCRLELLLRKFLQQAWIRGRSEKVRALQIAEVQLRICQRKRAIPQRILVILGLLHREVQPKVQNLQWPRSE